MSLRDVVGINAGDPTRPGPLEGIAIPGWYEDALCAQTDPEAFHPQKGNSTRPAKKICARCDVAEQCLEYALANGERHGIWGGKSEHERRKLEQTRRNGATETEVRPWANENGITCPPIGRVPISVREAFQADREAA